MEKTPLIEVNKRGLLTAIGAETIVIITLFAVGSISENDIITKAARIFMLIGAFGISSVWWISTATIQHQEMRVKNGECIALRYEQSEI